VIRGHVGRGTYVCAVPGSEDGAPFAWHGKLALAAQRTSDGSLRTIVRHAADPEIISFAAATSALDLFPVDLFRDITDRILRRTPLAALGLGPTEGHHRLRRAIAARAGTRLSRVAVVDGSQQGLDLVARCLLDPGDTVVMDRPGYLGAIQVFRSAGARVVGWDIARADFGELEDLLLRYRPKLLYTNPTFSNPTGRTLRPAERRDLLDLAARYHLPIVEDDPYSELWLKEAPPPGLHQIDTRDLVIYVSTFSKTLAGGLRLGWVQASEAIIDQLSLVRQRTDVCSPSLPQLVVAELLEGGAFDSHLATLRVEHARRHAAMQASIERWLPSGTLTGTPAEGGLALWRRLARDIDASALLEAATAEGVVFVAGDAFYPDAPGGAGRHELRLAFAGTHPAAIDDGIRRLAGVLQRVAGTTGSRTNSTPIQ
jgi:DNA-binding transcriptional MocR family regulator